MSKRHIGVAGLVAVAVLAGGCTDARTPLAPRSELDGVSANRLAAAQPAPEGQQQLLGRRAENARLAREIPGFGGMFYDVDGNLQVIIAQPASGAVMSAGQVTTKVRAAIAARSGAAATLGKVVVKKGQYGIAELEDMHDRARAVLATKGVVFVGTKESANRVAIGLDRTNRNPAQLQRQVLRQLAALGVSKAAIVIEQVDPVTPVTTLRDRVRGVVGGAQIYFPSPPGAFICSLGFNVRPPALSINFFVTASHCTQHQGGVENTQYFQALRDTNTFIGVEVLDPDYGSAGGYCPTGKRCRFSDASMGRYDANIEVAFGGLAHTTFTLIRKGSIELDPNAPQLTIIGEAPYPREGQSMSKVGRTTGWTTGIVQFTCVDVNVTGSDISLICQDIVEAGVGPGDSGSPVFQQVGISNRATLYGILWGSTSLVYGDGSTSTAFIFSDMENIHLELGAFRTF